MKLGKDTTISDNNGLYEISKGGKGESREMRNPDSNLRERRMSLAVCLTYGSDITLDSVASATIGKRRNRISCRSRDTR